MTASGPPGELSLEAVENDYWGDAPDDATTLVRTVYELRHKPIGDLRPGDLRILIGQGDGLEVLVPRALDQLADHPLMEADFYPGDLLATVLRVPVQYWSTHPELLVKADQIITAVDESELDLPVHSDLTGEITSFRGKARA